MRYHILFISIFVLNVITGFTLVFEIPLIGSFLRIVTIVIIPGWLLSQLVFGNSQDVPTEAKIIFSICFGSITAACIALFFARFSIPINMVSLSTPILIISTGLALFSQQRSNYPTPKTDAISLAILIAIPLLATAFTYMHLPVTREQYTEFFVQAKKLSVSNTGQDYAITISVINHEGGTHTYNLTCKQNDAQELHLASIVLEADQKYRAETEPSILHGHRQTPKSILNLYKNQELLPYRQIELTQIACDRLVINEKVYIFEVLDQ